MTDARYTHTNLIAHDWRTLSDFYVEVFGCEQTGPLRELSGHWIEALTAIPRATVEGVHLRLPGHGSDGPTLEVFTYQPQGTGGPDPVNRPGFGHLAFHVGDVEGALAEVLAHGGSSLGEIVQRDYSELGRLTAVYARDPEGNVLELQNWAR